MRLKRKVSFDPAADLERIAEFAQRWRSLFRPADVAYTPEHFRAELEKLDQAGSLRLYLITRPQKPIALAILENLSPDDFIQLLSLAPLDGQDSLRPWMASHGERRAAMAQAPAEPSGRGVYAFILGEPDGIAHIDLEPEGLVLALAHWGENNVLQVEPLLAQRMHLLGKQIQRLARPDMKKAEPDS